MIDTDIDDLRVLSIKSYEGDAAFVNGVRRTMKRSKWTNIVCLVALLSLIGGVALGDDKKTAKKYFSEGAKLFEQEKYKEAADAFRRAYQAKPAWKLMYNIGQSEAVAKRYGLALDAFEKYLALGGDDVSLDRREEVLAEVRRLRDMSGAVEIIAPAGALVVIDGVERGKTPLPGPLNVAAGVVHQVQVTLDGEIILERHAQVSGGNSITVRPDETKQETAEPAPAVESAPTDTSVTEEETDDGMSTLGVWGWSTAGLGAALLIGGAVTGGLTLGYNDVTSDETDKIEKRDDLALTTNILLGTGAAALVAGVVILIVDKKKKNTEESTARVNVQPLVGQDHFGAALRGSF
jgi:hypothetical protein